MFEYVALDPPSSGLLNGDHPEDLHSSARRRVQVAVFNAADSIGLHKFLLGYRLLWMWFSLEEARSGVHCVMSGERQQR